MEKAAAYLRLSKEDTGKDAPLYSKSIENQKELLERYAQTHGMEICAFYTDDDFSGLYFERPAFLAMLEAARQRSFSVILAKSQSRLSRNMEHAEYLLHDLFPMLGIRFIGVVDGVDTMQKYGKKARQINALVNEWYSEDLSESIRAVYREKMKKGEYLGAYAPYGYRKSTKDNHMLEPDEEAAPWVRRIYEWYVQGLSVRQIQQKLEHSKVPTPLSHRRGDTEASYCWSASTIRKILSNATYTGAVIQGKSRRRSFKDKSLQYLPQETWISVEAMHEALVEPELYRQAQKIRRGSNTKKE